MEFLRSVSELSSFSEQDQQRFDSITVFFDVFLDPNQQKLKALGPRLLNLKKHILPLRVFVNDFPIKFRLDEIDRLAFFESAPLSQDLNKPISIRFEFKTFTQTIERNASDTTLWEQEYSSAGLTISTLQKDNCLEWIIDWIRWHNRLYDVQRVILYDNGSSNRGELIAQLEKLSHEVKIIFVDWNFPHGIKLYKYAQPGSLNHARLKFPIPNSYCINLDIDEYLVMPNNGQSLFEYLENKLTHPDLGAVIFSQYLIPNITRSQSHGTPRMHHFPYRYKHFGKRSRNSWSEVMRMKYAYNFQKVGYNGAHRTMSEKNKVFSKRYSVLHLLKFYLKKCLREPFRYILLRQIPKPKIDACHASKDEIFFFHFVGLNTGWRTQQKPKREYFDDKLHIEEPLILQLAKKVDLVTPSTKK